MFFREINKCRFVKIKRLYTLFFFSFVSILKKARKIMFFLLTVKFVTKIWSKGGM